MTNRKSKIQARIEELELSPEVLRKGFALAVADKSVTVSDDGRASRTSTLRAERAIAKGLLRRLDAPALDVPPGVFGDLVPHEHQADAINLMALHGVVILTGGPGCGKTAVTKAALKMYEANGLSVACMAPTGKAAIRMTELTGHPASTIHRAIGMLPGMTAAGREEPIAADVVVVDEASMCDAELFSALVGALRESTRVLIVGDVDQLPSIGAGRVLWDLIITGKIPVARLTKIFRQASESRIPYVAKDINEGRTPDLYTPGTDVDYAACESDTRIAETVVELVASYIPETKGYTNGDVQVLVPQRKGECGVTVLNQLLQARLNPVTDNEGDVTIGGGSRDFSGYSARTGDRVIHTKNNKDLDVMNGEIGTVIASDPDGLDPRAYNAVTSGDSQTRVLLVVDYGREQPVGYSIKETNELELGFAITTHKSQGSQWKAVVVVASTSHAFMLTRALLYTAVTRAEKYCIICGQEAAVAKATTNTRGTERRTWLREFLVDGATPEAEATDRRNSL